MKSRESSFNVYIFVCQNKIVPRVFPSLRYPRFAIVWIPRTNEVYLFLNFRRTWCSNWPLFHANHLHNVYFSSVVSIHSFISQLSSFREDGSLQKHYNYTDRQRNTARDGVNNRNFHFAARISYKTINYDTIKRKERTYSQRRSSSIDETRPLDREHWKTVVPTFGRPLTCIHRLIALPFVGGTGKNRRKHLAYGYTWKELRLLRILVPRAMSPRFVLVSHGSRLLETLELITGWKNHGGKGETKQKAGFHAFRVSSTYSVD